MFSGAWGSLPGLLPSPATDVFPSPARFWQAALSGPCRTSWPGLFLHPTPLSLHKPTGCCPCLPTRYPISLPGSSLSMLSLSDFLHLYPKTPTPPQGAFSECARCVSAQSISGSPPASVPVSVGCGGCEACKEHLVFASFRSFAAAYVPLPLPPLLLRHLFSPAFSLVALSEPH